MSRPLILCTNDDGIQAAGLSILADRLSQVGDVIVSAPDQEQSAVGHGISLSRPLRVNTLSPGRHSVSGTPADSVLLGLFHLCPRRPDLVLSGINLGLNLGTDVFYSGTLAGALEGAIHGIPAIALSQEIPPSGSNGALAAESLLRRTADFAAQLAQHVLATRLPPRITLNVNAPAAPARDFVWTRLGRRAYREQVERRLDLRGTPYYWIGGPPLAGQSEPGTDGHALERGLLSITPLGLDLTADLGGWDRESWRPEGYQLAADE